MLRPTHPAALPDDVLLRDVEESRHRASGPGGQRRNKVETAVRLLHRPTGVACEANERRSLEDNRRTALRRLRRALALERRVVVDVDAFAPSQRWRDRTAGDRLAVSERHPDVPALLAEALDVLAACDDDVGEAARLLGVKSSRLVRVLQLEPAALAAVNARRRARGLKPYR